MNYWDLEQLVRDRTDATRRQAEASSRMGFDRRVPRRRRRRVARPVATALRALADRLAPQEPAAGGREEPAQRAA
ncbi:MAG: hypothetical protein ACREPA_09395 [Candidatus Dormibacteraceae bacterium]